MKFLIILTQILLVLMAVTYFFLGNQSDLLLLFGVFVFLITGSLVFTQRLSRRFKPPILAGCLAAILMGIATVVSAFLVETVPTLFGGQGYESYMFGGVLLTASFPIALVLALVSGTTVLLQAQKVS